MTPQPTSIAWVVGNIIAWIIIYNVAAALSALLSAVKLKCDFSRGLVARKYLLGEISAPGWIGTVWRPPLDRARSPLSNGLRIMRFGRCEVSTKGGTLAAIDWQFFEGISSAVLSPDRGR